MTERDAPQTFQTEDEPGPDANRRVEGPQAPSQELVEGQEHPVDQDAADAVGESAVGATTIPVAYEDTVRGTAGDTDPTTQQYREENWIPKEQKDMAAAMAVASDPERTDEANQRLSAAAMEDFAKKRADIQNDPRATELHPEYGTVGTEWGSDAHNALEATTREALEKAGDGSSYYTYNKLIERANGRKDNDYIEKELEGRRRLEQLASKRAERLEKWGAKLHNSPVSDEYKSRFPDFDFEPASLVGLENDTRRAQKELERAEEGLKQMNVFQIVEGMYMLNEDRDRYATGIQDLMVEASNGRDDYESLQRKWDELSHDKTKTAGELIDFYTDVANRGWLGRLRNRINLDKTLLDDINSGRASQSPEPSAPEQSAA